MVHYHEVFLMQLIQLENKRDTMRYLSFLVDRYQAETKIYGMKIRKMIFQHSIEVDQNLVNEHSIALLVLLHVVLQLNFVDVRYHRNYYNHVLHHHFFFVNNLFQLLRTCIVISNRNYSI